MAANFKAVILGDTHFPWCNWKLLRRILDVIDRVQPTHVIQMGDLYDLYSFSRHPRASSLITPRLELQRAREQAEEMWSLVRSAAPRASLHQLLGNHDHRIEKQVASRFPEVDALLEILDLHQLWRFDKVKTQKSQQDELFLNGIVFQHGHYSRIGQHARYNHQNTVTGHSHHGGVTTYRVRGANIWELNVGAIPDMKAKPFKYGFNDRIFSSVLGFGIIDELGPRFCPF